MAVDIWFRAFFCGFFLQFETMREKVESVNRNLYFCKL